MLKSSLDHLVVAIRSLPEGIAEFERLTGITAGVGGSHPDRGTENALVSLGPGRYLEIMAPQAGARLAGRDEAMHGLEHLRIIDWAVSVSDVDAAIAVVRRAGLATRPPRPGSRVTPSGEVLQWTVFGLADRSLPAAPFFIHWEPGTNHPSTTAPGGCTLAQLTILDPSPERLTGVLAALGVEGVTCATGAARIEARLACRDKIATLATSSSSQFGF